jgi:dipeptidyl aminopeptidase/acylaminoacyl peptidase
MSRTARLFAAILLLAMASSLACRQTIIAKGSRPSAAPAEDGRIPVAAFFRRPQLSHVRLSPDGQHIAAIASRDGLERLIVRPTYGSEVRTLTKLERTSRRVSWRIRKLGWASNSHLIVSVEMPSQTAVGVRARQSRLMVVPLDGSKIRYLGKKWPYQEYSGSQDNVVSWLWNDPDRILLSIWMPGQNQRGFGARTVNIHSGSLGTVARARYGMMGWAADHKDQVRVGWGQPKHGTDYFWYARVGPEDSFEKIIRYNPHEEEGFSFAGFSEEPHNIYVYSHSETGRDAIYSYDLEKRKVGALIFAHPEVDVTGTIHSSLDDRLLAIRYVTDRPRLHFVDAREAAIRRGIDKALPNRTNSIVSTDAKEHLSIIRSSGDTHPPKYYFFDREKKSLEYLFAAYPELDDVNLAPMRAIEYSARDGLTIPGYLTLPVEGEPPYPTVVYPHGGPWARDVWGWDAPVQFLASRGFAVLQPNFRGSDGYGDEFFELGRGNWGLQMQDDITDGTHWLIDQGIADPTRIGIYGASYGGFAALHGLMKEPELFKAGASFAGVTDILTLLSDDSRYWGLVEDMEQLVGDRWGDRKWLAAISPARNAERIHAPVLIAHGTEDWRVHVKQANAMANALEALDRPVETYLYQGEVHGFLDERNEIDFYTKLGAFFERYLMGPPAVATSGAAN